MTVRYIPLADGGYAKAYPDYSKIGPPEYHTARPVERAPYWYEVKTSNSTRALTRYMEPALLDKIDAWRNWSQQKSALESWYHDPRCGRALGYDHALSKFLEQNPKPAEPTRRELEIYEEAVRLYHAKAPPTRVPKEKTAEELAAEELSARRAAAYKAALEAVRGPRTEADLAVQLTDIIEKVAAYKDLCSEGGAYLLLADLRDKVSAIGAGLTAEQRRAVKELLGLDPDQRGYLGGVRFKDDPVRLPLRAFDPSHPIDEEMVAALRTMMTSSAKGQVSGHAAQVLRAMLNWDREQVQGKGTMAAIEELMGAPTRDLARYWSFDGSKRYNDSRKSYDADATVKLPTFLLEQLAFRLEHDEKANASGVDLLRLRMPNGGGTMMVRVRKNDRGFTFTGYLNEWAGGNRFENVTYTGGPLTAEQLAEGAELHLRGPYKGGPVTFQPCRPRRR